MGQYRIADPTEAIDWQHRQTHRWTDR